MTCNTTQQQQTCSCTNTSSYLQDAITRDDLLMEAGYVRTLRHIYQHELWKENSMTWLSRHGEIKDKRTLGQAGERYCNQIRYMEQREGGMKTSGMRERVYNQSHIKWVHSKLSHILEIRIQSAMEACSTSFSCASISLLYSRRSIPWRKQHEMKWRWNYSILSKNTRNATYSSLAI